QYAGNSDNILISGCIGPRKNECGSRDVMSSDEAAKYHQEQVLTFALCDVDFISGMSMNNASEAIGIVLAARTVGVPVVISLLVGTNGCLASGEKLSDAISIVDKATDQYVQHFMIQCKDPGVLQSLILSDAVRKDRVNGVSIYLAADGKSEHNDLLIKRCKTKELIDDFLEIRKAQPNFKVFGGSCDSNNDLLNQVCRQIFLLQ
ncbi:MAG: hypothetical protein C0490_26250, partial [Marivirga sp.]|nr:hypothetical protein [Marivirga sp.]